MVLSNDGNFYMEDCHLHWRIHRKHEVLSYVTIICCTDELTTDPHAVTAVLLGQHS